MRSRFIGCSSFNSYYSRKLTAHSDFQIATRLKPGVQVGRLHLAPPYLLNDPYIPRYASLSPTDAGKKRSLAYAHLSKCNLCPRRCDVNRFDRAGACLIQGNVVRVGTIAPHFGEEPCIQGHGGSGSIFFSGCNLRCVFCQNHEISHTRNGEELTPEQLAEWMIKLQDLGGVHNINLVTPEHVVPQIVLAILTAKDLGLKVPIVYNTSSYDSLESIELLDGLVDIYLPDFKVWAPATAKRLLKAEDYREHAVGAIRAMHKQVGDLCFTPDGLAKRGVLVRHLVMPGLEDESGHIVRCIATETGRDTVVHIMEQYSPRAHVGKGRRGKSGAREHVVDPDDVPTPPKTIKEEVRYADINRPVKMDEVSRVRKAAEEAGLWRFIEPARHGGFNI